MFNCFADACRARLPLEHLEALASLRVVPGVQVLRDETNLWLRWETDGDLVLRVILPLPDAVLFERREDRWHRVGEHLPSFDVPTLGDFQPLANMLFPAPVLPVAPPVRTPPPWQLQTLRLVSDPTPRVTSAVLTTRAALLAWVDAVTSARLQTLQFAHCDDDALLLGRRVPLLPSGLRFWGERVLRPLGFRVDPDLPERALLAAFGSEPGELAIVRDDRIELVSDDVLRPVTRAAVRLAAEEART